MRTPKSVAKLTELGRVRLSASFFMRDFLFSEIAAMHGLANVPDDPDLAIAAGTELCEQLLEPLQKAFGRIAIRSAFRSREVNALGNRLRLGCASNEKNAGRHIWDERDASGAMGATACIVVPNFADRFSELEDWKRLAWWVHDHLPYAEMEFYPVRWAFNLTWSEKPERSIYSMVPGSGGYLTRPGYPNHAGSHETCWQGILP